MIRVAGMRTGVEVSGQEVDSIMSPGLLFTQHQSVLESEFDFRQLAGPPTVRISNPHIWIHWLFDQNQVLGQLVMVSPEITLEAIAIEIGLDPTNPADLAQIANELFAGLIPGREYWRWNPNQAWPARFSMRGAEYLTGLDPTFTEVYSTPLGDFEFPSSETSLAGAEIRWQVTTDNGVVGALGRLKQGPQPLQRWLGNGDGLVSNLIPPGSDGVWHFEPLAEPQPTFLPLDLEETEEL